MDIFKVLAYNNDRAIRETVVSSILNYFMLPYGDHGLGPNVLSHVLKSIKGVCTFVDDALLARVNGYGVTDDFDVSVSSEWMPPDKQVFLGRRLDSLICIKDGRKTYFIGIEVKIYEDSSQDPEQVSDYAAMLALHRDLVLESADGLAMGGDDVKVALVYLVPGSSEKAFDFARRGSKACAENGIEGIIVLPWWKPQLDTSLKNTLTADQPMDSILRNVIHQHLYGEISPCDSQALDVLRSLSNAIGHRFVFKPERGESQFLIESEYEAGLTPTSRVLLREFREAAKAEGIKRPLAVSPRHTSIGVPFQGSPSRGTYNTLCRIETIESYSTGTPRDTFVLELSRNRFGKDLDQIRAVFKDAPIKVFVDDRLGQYHENGKQDEGVIRIYPDESGRPLSDADQAKMRAIYRYLLVVLRKIFQATV